MLTANAGFIAGRSVDRGYNTPTTDKYALKVQQVDRTTTLSEIQAWVDEAVQNNVWLILMFHQIDDDLAATFGTTPAILQSTVDYAASTGIEIVTMRDGVALMD